MKRIALLTLLFLMGIVVFSQEKQITIEDASYQNRALFSKRMNNLKWMGESDLLSFVDNNALIRLKANSEKRDTVLRLSELNAEMTKANADSLKKFPGVNYIDESAFYFTHKKVIYKYNLSDQYVSELNHYDEGAANVEIDPNHFNVAYTLDNNLFLSQGGKQIQITNDADKGIVNGQTVHRVEFGIKKGIFFSPQGNYLAFYRKDETMVSDYPLVDINEGIATTNNIKYPMAGAISEEVTLGVYNIQSGQTIFLKTGQPADHYLTGISWGPDEKYIYIGVLNRDQNHLKLNQYDVANGDFVKTLFEEKSDKYVEPEHGMVFLNSKPDEFIWQSEKDGFNHLYLYNTSGDLISQLTSGDWVVTSFLGTDPKDHYAYFISTASRPLNKDIYSVSIKSGDIKMLSPATGNNRAILSPNGKYLVDIYSDTVSNGIYQVISTKGKIQQRIFTVNNPLEDYKLGQLNIFKIQADDGTDLYCRMITPPDFDPSKQYPVLVYVYGGPHAQLITNSPLGGARLYLYYMAQQGYIVFTLDNRGSANRGRDFEQAVFRDMGTQELADQMTGIKYLKKLPYVDGERIGVNGWSYGGFMTLTMMLRQPETFKVGACGGPVTDWKYYEVMYGERYMDTPETNPEGYENSSVFNYVQDFQGKLLIIHGTHDPTVVWQQSLALIDAFIKAGKQVDYFVYPGHGHGVGGKDRLHLNKKMADYFIENL